MALKTEPISKCLDKKLLMLGFEVPDLLAIFLLLTLLNFAFGESSAKPFLVWLPTIAAAVTLRLGKRGKPDNYLLHLVKFCFSPKHLEAFPSDEAPLPPRIKNENATKYASGSLGIRT